VLLPPAVVGKAGAGPAPRPLHPSHAPFDYNRVAAKCKAVVALSLRTARLKAQTSSGERDSCAAFSIHSGFAQKKGVWNFEALKTPAFN
jgi:hypothetical protein